MTIIAITVLAFVATTLALYPLFKGESGPVVRQGTDPAIENLLSQREATYGAIKDLEFDRAQGKLSEADYQDLRAKYEAKAITILQQLKTEASPKKNDGASSSQAGRHCEHCGTSLTAEDRFCSACGKSQSARCSICGAGLTEQDHFCRQCGTVVLNAAAA